MCSIARRLGPALALLLAALSAAAWAGSTDAPTSTISAGQRYLVIGSFARQENARQWAALNADFGTSVQRIFMSDGRWSYRVLVGPLSLQETPLVQAMLDAVGVAEHWPLPVCATTPCAGISRATVALIEAR